MNQPRLSVGQWSAIARSGQRRVDCGSWLGSTTVLVHKDRAPEFKDIPSFLVEAVSCALPRRFAEYIDANDRIFMKATNKFDGPYVAFEGGGLVVWFDLALVEALVMPDAFVRRIDTADHVRYIAVDSLAKTTVILAGRMM